MRKNLFEYDQVLNTQRDKVYSLRRQALLEPDLSKQLLDFSARTMDDILEVCFASEEHRSPRLHAADELQPQLREGPCCRWSVLSRLIRGAIKTSQAYFSSCVASSAASAAH